MEQQKTQAPPVQPILVEPGVLSRIGWLLQHAFTAAFKDGCFSIAKGAAYSFLLSLFPVLTTLTAILIEFRAQSIMRIIATFVTQVAPPGTQDLILWRLHQRGRPLTLSVAAILIALWAGSGAMMSLMEGFQAAHRIPSGRPFLKQRAMAIFLVLITAAPVVVASAFIIAGDRGAQTFVRWVGGSLDAQELSTPFTLAWRIGRYLVAFVTTTFVTTLLYYFGPNHRPETVHARTVWESRFMRAWPGAVVATLLWLLTTAGFGWYVRHVAHYNIFYGSIWAVIVLLIWLYLMACIALVGCEFNAERERLGLLALLPGNE